MADPAAFESLAQGAAGWNNWRRTVDVFGDYRLAKVDLSKVDIPPRAYSGYMLQNIRLERAEISGSDFSGCDLSYSDLLMCRALGTNFRGASLRGCRLSRAYLRGADLSETDLKEVDFRRASLTGANLLRADVRGVDLSSTRGLTQHQIEEAIGDMQTRIPPHLVYPRRWQQASQSSERVRVGDLELPSEAPASIEAFVDAGMVRASADTGQAQFAATMDPGMLRKEISSDIDAIITRVDNVPELRRTLSAYAQALVLDDSHIIILGLRGLKLRIAYDQVLSSSDEDAPALSSDIRSYLDGIILQNRLLLQQSHRWRAFIEEAQALEENITDPQVVRSAGEVVLQETQQHPGFFEQSVRDRLKMVCDEIEGAVRPARLAAANFILSIANICQAIAAWSVKEMRRFGVLSWSTFRDNLAAVVGHTAAAAIVYFFSAPIISSLAKQFPDQLGWVESVFRLLSAREGGSSD